MTQRHRFFQGANTKNILFLLRPDDGTKSDMTVQRSDSISMPSPLSLTIPLWYDLHVHVRQGHEAMAAYIADHRAMGCCGLVAMPNTKPPVTVVFEKDKNGDSISSWSLEAYRSMIGRAGGDAFLEVIVPLYLSAHTTVQEIEAGAKTGLLRACKYYPPHGTTNAEHGLPLSVFEKTGILAAMQAHNVVLCLHGEEHGLQGERYFGSTTNAEKTFYCETLPRIRTLYPDLKIVCEHITTKEAVDFVKNAGPSTAATITPQHLLYTVGDLLQGLRYHLYCLPLVKFEEDQGALRDAVRNEDNTQFFAGTDSAPHAKKATECGCAAGCYTGGIAPQLYADVFDLPKESKAFERFLCRNGPAFYSLPVPDKTFTLTKIKSPVPPPVLTPDGMIVSLAEGMGWPHLNWSLSLNAPREKR